ncbi:MAG: hypothetical protein WC676_01445 [Candidatus Omnitrophota bacterium]
MIKFFCQKKAASTLEYVALIILMIGAILLMQKYILRGLAGRWKSASEVFSEGRQYDPQKTTECLWAQGEHEGWYSLQCYNACYDPIHTSCVSGCEGGLYNHYQACLNGCYDMFCDPDSMFYDPACATICRDRCNQSNGNPSQFHGDCERSCELTEEQNCIEDCINADDNICQ